MNRQPYAGQETFDHYNDQGYRGEAVVFAPSARTERPPTSRSTNPWQRPPGRQVLREHPQPAKSWVGQTNGADTFDAVDRHDNVHGIDWYTASAGHDE